MTHDVFISYSSKDKPIADAVCANIEAASIRCWIAPRDIAAGEDWPTAITRAISQSRIMVLVFSASSNSSEDVSREIILAANSKLVIIPFKIDNVEPEPGKQYYLARTHWLDAMNPPTREQIRRLVRTVKNLLTLESPPAPPVTPESPPAAIEVVPSVKASRFKPWMLWIAIPSLILALAICIGGIYLAKKILPVKTNSLTPAWTATVPGLTLPLTSVPDTTLTSVPLPTGAVSVDVHATAGTVLDVPGNFVAWSPDGKWLIIGEQDIQIYDAQSMSEVHTLQAKYFVGGLAISPDSQLLAAIDISNAVKLFNLNTGSELLTFPRTEISTSAASSSFLAFSPDSLTLAVVLGDTVKFFNVTSGQETGTLVAQGIMSILFSPDGQKLYAGGWNGITVWNVSTATQILSMGDTTNEGNCLALSPDGTLLASGGSFDQPIVLWETATGHQLRSFAGHTGGINRLIFSPDGNLLASAAGDVTIKLWDVTTGNLLQTLLGHTQAATSLAFSPDGTTLVSGSQDGTTRLWTLSAAKPEPTATLASSSFNPLPTAIPLSSRAIGVENAVQVKNLNVMDVEGTLMAWSPDGKWLVIGGQKIHIYDAQSMSEVHTLQAKYFVGGLAISPDSQTLAAIDISNAVKLFNLNTGSELLTLPRTEISTSAASNSFLAFSPDSLTLAIIIGDTVKLFDVTSGQETGTIVTKGAYAILLSPDGQSLYAGGWSSLTAWNVSAGAQVLTFGDFSTDGSHLALSPDGSLLASGGSSDQPMVLWEAATGRQLRTFSGHTDGVNSLVFSPDGRLLASAAGDVTIKLWDVDTGSLLQTLVGHTQAATSLAFSPDGATLASIAYDQGIWLWGVP